MDRPLGGGVCSHPALPHIAADRNGLLEVRDANDTESFLSTTPHPQIYMGAVCLDFLRTNSVEPVV